MDTKNFLRSKGFQATVIIVGVLLVALISFAAGLNIGMRKAKFFCAFGENYERNFGSGFGNERRAGSRMNGGPERKMPMPDFDRKGFRNGHGLVGEIISVAENSLVVKDIFGNENTISVKEGTVLKNGRESVDFSTLSVGDRMAVIGEPSENGTVEAKFVRVLIDPFEE